MSTLMKNWRKEEDTYQACPMNQKVEEDGIAEGELALTGPKEEIIAIEEEGETITTKLINKLTQIIYLIMLRANKEIIQYSKG